MLLTSNDRLQYRKVAALGIPDPASQRRVVGFAGDTIEMEERFVPTQVVHTPKPDGAFLPCRTAPLK